MVPDSHIKKILVTGGAGYVGSALVAALVEAGYEITVLDLMIFGECAASPAVHIFKGDIRDEALLRHVIPGHDAIIHLAFVSNDPDYELPPVIGEEINVRAFCPLIERCLREGVQRFIFPSSCSIYGKKDGAQIVDEESLPAPLTAYARNKLACEALLLEYRQPGFCPVIVRPATICGCSPRQRFDLSFNRMICSAYYTRCIHIPNAASIRPYLHINDMTRLYMKLLQLPEHRLAGMVWNVAAGGDQSLLEAARSVQKVFGKDITLTFEEAKNDLRSYSVSSDRIAREIGFIPQFSLCDAAEQFQQAFEQGKYADALSNQEYYNVQVQKRVQWKMYDLA